jgi:hypothetical protein
MRKLTVLTCLALAAAPAATVSVAATEASAGDCRGEGRDAGRHDCGRRYAVACRTETHYRDHRPYRVRLCEGRDGVWRPV